MYKRSQFAVLAAAVLATLPLFGAVTIENNTTIVATVTPFAETAWLSVDSTHFDWTPWYVTDTDGDGVVRLEYPGGVPSMGLWLGVDLSNGETMSIRTFFGSAMESIESAFPSKMFLRDGSGEYSQLSLPGSASAFLLVRPGTGVWYFQGQDSTDSDRDAGANDLITADLSDFTPLGPAAPVPSGIEPGDRFFSIAHAIYWYGDTVDSHLAETNGPGVLSFAKRELVGIYENQGPFQVNVLRTEGTDGVLSVDYTTVDQTAHAPIDYEHRAGTLTFAAGERLKMIEIPIVNNSTFSGIRRFRMELSNGDTLEVQIADDDDPQIPMITVDDTTAIEDTAAHFTVHLSEPAPTAVSFMATTVAGTATASLDFEPGTQTVSIPPGNTSASFTVPIVNDVLDEPDEAFTVTFSNSASAVLADTSAEAVIIDDDAPLPELLVDDVLVSERAGAAIFTVRLSAESASEIEVGYETLAGTASAATDFGNTLNSVVFAPGEVAKTISIPIVNDRVAEPNESFYLRVFIGGADPQAIATCTILNDDRGRTRAVRH
jgi:hypothetical protein